MLKKQKLKWLSGVAFACLGCLGATPSQETIEASRLGATHIGTFEGSTTFTTSSSNGINPGLFIEVMDDDGNLTQYESEDGVITIHDTKEGAYVTQAKLLGKTKYVDQDTGEILDEWEDGRNLRLESVREPVLTTTNFLSLYEPTKNNINNFDAFNFKGYTEEDVIVFPTMGHFQAIEVDVRHFKDKYNQTLLQLNRKHKIKFEVIENTVTNNNNMTIQTSGIFLGFNKVLKGGETGTFYFEKEITNIPEETVHGSGQLFKINTNNPTDGVLKIRVTFGVGDILNPNKSNILTLNESVELRSIGNEKDILDLNTGELTQRIGEVVLDGSEDWEKRANTSSFWTYRDLSNFSSIESDITINLIGNEIIPKSFKYAFDSSSIPLSDIPYAGCRGSEVAMSYGNNTTKTLTQFKTELSENPLEFYYISSSPAIKSVELNATHQFPLLDKSFVQVNGTIPPVITSITVPTDELSFTLDPNQEAGQQFIAPEFEVTNESNAPLTLTLKTFEQTTDVLNDVLPTEHESWDDLTKEQSKDIALGLVTRPSDDWLNRIEKTHYVSETTNNLLGTIKPKGTVGFEFIAHHGRAFSEMLSPSYRLTFVFDLLK